MHWNLAVEVLKKGQQSEVEFCDSAFCWSMQGSLYTCAYWSLSLSTSTHLSSLSRQAPKKMMTRHHFLHCQNSSLLWHTRRCWMRDRTWLFLVCVCSFGTRSFASMKTLIQIVWNNHVMVKVQVLETVTNSENGPRNHLKVAFCCIQSWFEGRKHPMVVWGGLGKLTTSEACATMKFGILTISPAAIVGCDKGYLG